MIAERLRTWLWAAVAISAAAGVEIGTVAAARARVTQGALQPDAVRVEAALRVGDLQIVRRHAEHERQILLQSGVGRAYYGDDGSSAASGNDWLAILQQVIELAAPGGQPVPVSLAVFSRGDQVGMIGRVAVQGGFDNRLRAAALSDETGAWWVKAVGDGADDPREAERVVDTATAGDRAQGRYVIGVAGAHIQATLGSDGWLHLTAGRVPGVGLQDVLELTRASPAVRTAFEQGDAALALYGDGRLTSLLTDAIEHPVGRVVAESVQAAILSWGTDGAKTTAWSLLFDSPLIERLAGAQAAEAGAGPAEEGSLSAREDPPPSDERADAGGATSAAATDPAKERADPASIRWGPDMTRLVSLEMTPGTVRAVGMIVEHFLKASHGPHDGSTGSEAPPAIPEQVAGALAGLRGRLEAVSFDSPADWAVAVGCADEAATARIVPWLQRSLAALASTPVHRIGGVYELEPADDDVAEGAAVLHARPAAALQGIRATHWGRTVVVARQRSRLRQILALQTQEAAPSPASAGEAAQLGGGLDIPVTPAVRELLASPALVRGYAVLGNDGAWMEWMSWGASHLVAARRRQKRQSGRVAKTEGVVERWLASLPAALVLNGAGWMMTYDVAFAADIRDGMLIVNLRASQI